MPVCYQSQKQPDRFIRIKHELECVFLVHSIVGIHRPDVFIELGTHSGGFTLSLNERFPDLMIYTVDKFSRNFIRAGYGAVKLCDENVCFITADVIDGDSRALVELLKCKSRKILYCDNGNKLAEMKNFCHLLNKGDLIGVHDWLSRVPLSARGAEYLKKRLKHDGVLENTAIIEEDEIQGLLSENGFKKYHWKIFESYPKYNWINEVGEKTDIMLTDPRAASRFWIKE